MAEAKKAQYYYSRGRRKEATARVRLYLGKGESKINEQDINVYFKDNTLLVSNMMEPLKLTGNTDKIHLQVMVKGGGLSGQSDAIRLGISRALIIYDENLKITLRKAGFLTRDQREKERKKYGLKRARKAPQFSKR